MKELILVRHGKSAWDNLLLSDHDRPLAPRGIRDIPVMAHRLMARGISPDYFLSSTALRAKETAFQTAKILKFPAEKIVLTKALYHASPQNILDLIHSIPNEYHTALFFGHNPGFNDLIDKLGEDLHNLPTSGQYGFQADISSWVEFGKKTCSSFFFDYPKKKD